jgi:hypothetical protein
MRKHSLGWIAAFVVGSWPVVLTIYMAILSRQAGKYALAIAGPAVLVIALAWVLGGRKELQSVVKAFMSCTGLYCLVLLGGILLLLVGCALVGYLPYSDRPGPGWGAPHLPGWEEIRFYMGWEFLVVPVLLFWGTIFFAFARLIAWLRVPRWLLGLSAGILCGLLSLVVTAGVGWYISIAAFPVYGAGVLGLLFGCVVLPRFAPKEKGVKWPAWLRAIGATTAMLALGAAIIYPILPERDSQELEVVFVRLGPEMGLITVDSDKLSVDDIKRLRSIGLRGSVRVGMQASKTTGNGSRHARAIIVLRERLETRVDLREPKATTVVYVQDGKNWNMYPPGARTIDKKISFWPSEVDSTDLELEIEPRMSSSSSFSRYAPLNAR